MEFRQASSYGVRFALISLREEALEDLERRGYLGGYDQIKGPVGTTS